MKIKNAFLKSAALLAMLVASQAQANATTISIPGGTMPWLNSANPSLAYGSATFLTAAKGAGNPVIISLASNVTSVSFSGGAGSYIFGNANIQTRIEGDVFVNGQTYENFGTGGVGATQNGVYGQKLPSYYMEPQSSPTEIYFGELIGAFANSSGVVEGTPFAIGSMSVTEVVPTGATELLLGDNIDGTSAPVGSYTVNYSLTTSGNNGGVAPTPELPTYLMGLLGLGGIALLRRRQSQA